ncbi:HAD family hydrolase [Gehongia tenuis]|uniref:HAD family phosphatase n=1 Tax=Gehongia tenuis TaxID=2763655 RepID=A0A926D5L1_9FIRM|nr:HAD family phosphatase [Gehongia tenuis]MBC8532051.1 HAD family phosphatase [Gehongia tenuis]
MIRNVVFDMGQVLGCFDPPAIVAAFGLEGEDADRVRRAVFEGEEWQGLDLGIHTEDTMIEPVCRRLPPRLRESAAKVLLGWIQYFSPIPGMEPVTQALHESGYRLYLLSNISRNFRRHIGQYPALAHFDGCLLSGEERVVKPDPAIYRRFFERFDLRPEECFFIDDRPDNIAAGAAFGMRGFVYGGEIPPLLTALRDAGLAI